MTYDIRKGDYVRIHHAERWNNDSADVIDWGFLVALDSDDKEFYLLKSNIPFQIVIRANKEMLDKIIVEHSPKREFQYISEAKINEGAYFMDTIWKLKSDRDDVVLLVVNPRMEPDADDDGEIYYTPEWDKILKEDGTELTAEEEEMYISDLKESLKDMFHD